MGLLVDGKWHDKWYPTEKTEGRFIREDAQFRNRIKSDRSTEYAPQSGRYHLYVSLACPWAHRALIMRKLKRLEEVISVSTVEPMMLDNGWMFSQKYPDPLYNCKYLYEIYVKAKADYSGRVTVPVLWDKETETIVNNESAEIIRIFNSEFNAFTSEKYDYYPQELQQQIDRTNEFVYTDVNNGVYRAGFATTQEAYDEAVTALFDALDELEQQLSDQDYLVGNRLTEADVRLFTTLIRFDLVYVGHFKCNLRRLIDYPNLSAFIRRIYDIPGVSETIDIEFIKKHYYGSHRHINPTGVVPKGPVEWIRNEKG
jgi:putative glutathione S-transferase